MEILVLIIYIAALTVLFAYGLQSFSMVYQYSKLKPSDPVVAGIEHDDDIPRVTVQLPLYNELYVAGRLVDAVCALDYPRNKLEIQLLDDSTDETTDLLARLVARKREDGIDIHHIRRPDRAGFKAGALSNGLARASGEYIAIFDADFLPPSDFLLKIIPHLTADPGLGMVQARWEHINHDYSLLTRMQALALDAHFAMEQQVRNHARLFMNFNGTAGVWRRQCIEDAGNWHADTLTEDLDLSYRAQLRGWRFLYLNDLAVPAELPSEINGLKSQQFRWTKGAIETAKKHLPELWRARLPLRVKLHATAHLTSNLVFPFILIIALLNVPVLYLKELHPEWRPWFHVMGIFFFTSISTFLFYLLAQKDIRENWRSRMLLFPIFMAGTMGLAVNNSKAVLEALFNRRTTFERTPKYNIVTSADKWTSSAYRQVTIRVEVVVELLMALYFMVAIGISIAYMEISLIPFQLMFLFGFGLAGGLSLRQALGRKETGRKIAGNEIPLTEP